MPSAASPKGDPSCPVSPRHRALPVGTFYASSEELGDPGSIPDTDAVKGARIRANSSCTGCAGSRNLLLVLPVCVERKVKMEALYSKEKRTESTGWHHSYRHFVCVRYNHYAHLPLAEIKHKHRLTKQLSCTPALAP